MYLFPQKNPPENYSSKFFYVIILFQFYRHKQIHIIFIRRKKQLLLNSKNIHILKKDGKEILLVGTAHVSKDSAREVKELIEQEKPDSVCVELCPARYKGINNRNKWKNMDIITIIKQKKAPLLLVNLILSSFQKRLAQQLGINPGQEMIQAISSAKEINARLVLADRDIQVTFTRVWKKLSFWGKMRILFMLIFSMFSKEKISEEEIERLKSEDVLTVALSELARSFPRLKNTLIDERDQYLAEKIKLAPGDKVIAIVGAGHVPGIKKEIDKEHDLTALIKIPSTSSYIKVLVWGIPLAIIAIIASTFTYSPPAGFEQITQWFLWNGSLSALGALIAMAHPLSILTAFVAAPFSSLNPLLAAGWFAGIAEALIRRPRVEDFEQLGDITSLKDFFHNRVTKILLVVAFANLGSMAGTFIGGAKVIQLFINTINP
ncbi:TraB/GumN family protein [Candidatus Atribacteria bacterium 1244-E10-H5-B2]|nr:MAG: TraB/GumN family protein [Candidatus Atribacteria bacterium 1244-E10-H5-B2]